MNRVLTVLFFAAAAADSIFLYHTNINIIKRSIIQVKKMIWQSVN